MLFDMRQPKILFQARDSTDSPAAGALSYVVRRGLQVGAGSISTSVNSPDPGVTRAGDICLVLRNGSVISGAVVTLLGDPVYDPDLRQWNVATSLSGAWTPAVDDRLVLAPGVPAHYVEIYDDPLGGSVASQPVTLPTSAIFEQWAQHSGYDVVTTFGGETKYDVGGPDEVKSYVTPEEFGAVGDGVTVDSDAVQAAMDYAHSVGGITVRTLPKVYRVGDLAIRRGVAVKGSYVYRSQADQRYRGTMFVSPRPGVVNGVIYGVGTDSSQESSDRLRGFSFEAITFANAWLEDDWTSGIADPDNKPIVLLEDVVRAHFKDCEFTHADRHAMILRGVWDSRFDNLRFMESGNDLVGGVSSGTYYSTVLIDQSTGYGGGCNNLYWNDCVWESNAQLAIECATGDHNECYWTNCKIESATGEGPIAAFTGCTAFSFHNFQTTTTFDDPTVSAVTFNSCTSCYGNFLMEHLQGSGNQCDHYMELTSCSMNDFTVTVYGYDQSVNGIIGDSNEYENMIRTTHHGTRTANHGVTAYHEANVHYFPVDTGETSILLRRKDKSTYHWLGRLEDDGAGGAVYKHMANGNVAYRVLADGTLLLNRPLNFYGGGTFDPADLKGRLSKEMFTTSKDGTNIGSQDEMNIFGSWDPNARTSGSSIGEGRLLIRATQTGGGVIRLTGTKVNPDGTTTGGFTEDISITDTTGALPTDASGVAYPDQTNMYLSDTVFRGGVNVTTVSGTASVLAMYTVQLDDWDDEVSTGRNIHINRVNFNAWCRDVSGGAPIMRAHFMFFDYDAATKKISCSTHAEITLTGAVGYRLTSERLIDDDLLNERLKILAFCYHSGLNAFGTHWNSFGAYLKADYELF